MDPQRSGMPSGDPEKQAAKQEQANADRITPAPTNSSQPNGANNPFTTPGNRTPNGQTPRGSVPASRAQSTRGGAPGTSTATYMPGGAKYFRSRRVKKGEIERPWLETREPKEKWVTIIPIIGMALGLIISGLLIWDGLRTVNNFSYCPVLDEDWSGGWNDKVWSREIQLGGYGNGQFEVTTDSEENSYIEDGVFVIKPTLQDENLVENDNILDLRGSGGCTGTKWTDCLTATNTTNGTIVNPVKSARINTKLGASIKYGRVEVTAKLPAGDWIWPAIWMLPTESKYGAWPKSGEIDIMESRGNNYTFSQGGNNIVSSTLHFGPNSANDGWWRNNVKRQALHTTYSAAYHTYGVEWSQKYIFTYIDSRLLQVMYTHFDEPFYKYGRFPLSDSNGTRLEDPWGHTGNNASPFDEDFYLVINVAVGGTNGWFKDGASGKPWLDGSPSAKKDFWNSREQWYPTWEKEGSLKIKSVKIWQQKGWNDC